jgi:hypothetical protein
MRYLRIVLPLLAVSVGTQACIVPIPVGPGVIVTITTAGVKRMM